MVDSNTPYTDELPSIPEQSLKPEGSLVTLQKAQGTARILSFQISYDGNSLPSSIEIGEELLHGALKNGALYCAITVALTRGNHRVSNSEVMLNHTPCPL